MNLKPRNRIFWVMGIVLLLAVIILAKVILYSTAGPLNPSVLPEWYLPSVDGEREEILGALGKDQYSSLEKTPSQSPAELPALSQYVASEWYMRRGSSDTYQVVSWYFDNQNDFYHAKSRLLDYLVTTGTIHQDSLDMSRQYHDFEDVRRINDVLFCPEIPVTLHTTAYESPDKNGYFFSVKKPINPDHEDYFIIGYLADSGDLPGQTAFLRDLIARGYYNVTGSYDGLKQGE